MVDLILSGWLDFNRIIKFERMTRTDDRHSVGGRGSEFRSCASILTMIGETPIDPNPKTRQYENVGQLG